MNLAIGFFDGVHLGHRRILSQADMALTFAEHPLAVLAPERSPALLMTLEERLAAIRDALRQNSSTGESEKVQALHFTRELAAMPPSDFAAMLRRNYPDLGTIYCGPNWNFGAGGAGNADFLVNMGFSVRTVPFELAEGGANERNGDVKMPVSSTRIRSALMAGDVQGAAVMLGRNYAISGEVRRGKGRGGELGFPTINLHPANPDLRRLLPYGVYAVRTELGRGIANWGVAPTMGGEAWPQPVFEVHLLNASAPVRQAGGVSTLAASLVAYIRAERKFASVDELKKQVARDVERAECSF